MTGERERLEPLRELVDEVLAPWPGWDGESPYVELVAIDPVTRTRLGHRFVPVTTVRPEPATPHLYLAVSADHDKTKDELPRRPRGPHPYLTGEAS